MQIAKDNPSSTSALDLSEIRARIAIFLDRKTCVSCIRVSRDWFKDFAPFVWHAIDFDVDDHDDHAFSRFLDKYGSFISVVRNISHTSDLRSIQHHNVSALKSIQVRHTGDHHLQERLSDLLLRCSGSIHALEIRYPVPVPNSRTRQKEQPGNYVRVADIIATSSFSSSTDNRINTRCGNCLVILKLEFACLTREAFSTLLRGSPSLDKLTLHRVVVVGHKSSVPLYTGSSLRYLSASLNQIYAMDVDDQDAPSLLLHFPLLKEWSISLMNQPCHWPTGPVRKDFSTCCPDLKTITFGKEGCELTSNLLINSFQKVEACTLISENLTPATALGLIAHQATLTSVTVNDIMEDSSWTQWFHMIPRLCTKLQILSLVSFKFDSKTLDTFKWGCKGLQELRVRFQDLDDDREIEECLKQLYDWRRFGGGALTPHKNNMNAETRVCQFLFQFKSLRTVWLGTKDCYLPPLYEPRP
ncbi:hypothetical protein BKA57DRAFT_442705 [Linnemannia elongata]|nr:hypothetical protein BKA57DRAFT_442705 [Linnemannia elongata]